MKQKEEMPDDKSSVSHFDWYWISNLSLLCHQTDCHYAALIELVHSGRSRPPRERLFLISGSLVKAESFHVPGSGREALFALPALLLRFIGGKGPDQVLLALAPPVVISRQDPVDCVQVVCQAQLRVLRLP